MTSHRTLVSFARPPRTCPTPARTAPSRGLSRVAALVLLIAARPSSADHLMLQVEDFEGDWRRQTNISGYLGKGFCTSNANPKVASSKMTKSVTIHEGGKHAVWARGYTSSNSRRAFCVQVGSTIFDRTHTRTRRGWIWEKAGEIDLEPGKVTLAVRDADKGYESVDAVLLTDRLEIDPGAEARRWEVYGGKVPDEANAIRFNIDALCRILAQRADPDDRAAWEARRGKTRKRLIAALGLEPMPRRTPLNARVTGRAERDDYRIENVVFESEPNFYVTANVYIPKKVKLPAPAVVVVPGHAMKDGKNYGLYLTAQIGLVRQGIIVLGYDPIGQGERRVPGFDHILGYGSLLVGRTNEGMITWDTSRAVDYLLSRDDVDPKRLGLAGNSGGGENTFYAMPVETRFAVGTSFCFVCSYEQFFRYGGNHCICNHLPGIVHHMEEFEILGLNVPKPFLFGNGIKDRIFPIKGVRETYRRANRIYAMYDAAHKLRSVEVDLGHGWSQPLREACYGWMAKWLCGRGNGDPIAETFDPPDANSPDLLCLKDGKMPDGYETVVTLNRKLADRLRSAYAEPPTAPQAWKQRAAEWRNDVWACFGGRPDAFAPTAKRVRTFDWDGHSVEVLRLVTEPGIEIPTVFVRPKGAAKPGTACLVLGLDDKARVQSDERVRSMLAKGSAVLAVDLRGLGEAHCHENHLTSDSVCLGRHIFAQRVWDVMQAARYLASRQDVDAAHIRCDGRGACGLHGLFAVALGSSIESIELTEPLASFRYFLENKQSQPIWLAVPNLLKVIDVGQVVALAAPKPVTLISPVGYAKKPLTTKQARDEFAFATKVYDLCGTEGPLMIR